MVSVFKLSLPDIKVIRARSASAKAASAVLAVRTTNTKK